MIDRHAPGAEDEPPAHVAGELPVDRHAAVEAWLVSHPEDAARVAEWRAQAGANPPPYCGGGAEPAPAAKVLPARTPGWNKHTAPRATSEAELGEFFGSLGLIAGFLTRFSAFGILCVMTGAVTMVHWDNGFFMNWSGKQGGEGFEYHLLAMGMAVALIVSGGGKYSVDGWIARTFFNKKAGAATPPFSERVATHTSIPGSAS